MELKIIMNEAEQGIINRVSSWVDSLPESDPIRAWPLGDRLSEFEKILIWDLHYTECNPSFSTDAQEPSPADLAILHTMRSAYPSTDDEIWDRFYGDVLETLDILVAGDESTLQASDG